MTRLAIADPDRRLALHYARADRREALSALWALDEGLGRIVASTTQPMIGQMRLTWWHERLCALGTGPVPAEPVLVALTAHVLRHGVSGARMAGLVAGWEALLDDPLSEDALNAYADGRGTALFTLSGALLEGGADDFAGRCWALTDFARHCANRTLAKRALALADGTPQPTRALAKPLRVLAWLAHYDVKHGCAALRPRWTILRAALA